MTQLLDKLSRSFLFPLPPTITFGPHTDPCGHCQQPLKVLKTKSRDVVTLHIGMFHAQETISICDHCRRTYGSPQLRRLVAPGCNFGYDVLVYVGRALFLRHRCSQEIRDELAAKNVRISPSEVNYLGRKFIVYLAIAHRQCAPRIKQAMDAKGGYILHLDGTCEGEGPLLMSGLDAITEIVLGNVKLPSEKADTIIPFLEQIKQRFGEPVASVHDMGAGIRNAVDTVFPDNPDFICHFHFLPDVGKDLLEPDYQLIRKRLRKHGITTKLHTLARKLKTVIDEHPDLVEDFRAQAQAPAVSYASVELIPTITTYSLILWTLAGKHQGDGYGFPFDRPHVVFVQRLLSVYRQLQEIKKIQLRGQWRDNRPLNKLSCDLEPVSSDKALQRLLADLEPKVAVFDELRQTMRVAPMAGTHGLNDDATDEDIQTIEGNVQKFRQRLENDPAYAGNPTYQPMIDQIDKYWKKLFADPISVDTPKGKVSIQPQRTNNLMERFFRDFRRGHRRRSGHNAMSRTLQTMLAETPLVKNLENDSYMRILLDGKPTLEDLLAGIDIALVRHQLHDAQPPLGSMPTGIKKMISQAEFPRVIARIFSSSRSTRPPESLGPPLPAQ